MAELIDQPGPAPSRKMAAAALGGMVAAPLLSAAALSPLLTWGWGIACPGCAPMPEPAAAALATLLGGLGSFVAGYLVRERA